MGNEFEYKSIDFNGHSGVEISKYCGAPDAIVPSMLGGKNIVGISREAFAGNYSLKSVTLPDTLLYIDREAFARCYSLKLVKIPGSIIKVGEKAFSSCCSLQSCEFSGSKVQWSKVEVGPGNDSLIKTLGFGGIESLTIRSGGRQIVLAPHLKFFLKSNEEIELISIVNENTIRFSHGAGQLEDLRPGDYGKVFFDQIDLQKNKAAAEKAAEEAKKLREEERKKAEHEQKEKRERQQKDETAREEAQQEWWKESHVLDSRSQSNPIKPTIPTERPKLDFFHDNDNGLDEIVLADLDTSKISMRNQPEVEKKGAYHFVIFDDSGLTPEQSFVVRITGTNHENRELAVSKLSKGQELFMVPDLHNIFDDHCIRVYTFQGEDVGFVSRDFNRGIFEQLQEGYRFKCCVENIEEATKGYFFLMRIRRYPKNC